jgi:hypothetical protein
MVVVSALWSTSGLTSLCGFLQPILSQRFSLLHLPTFRLSMEPLNVKQYSDLGSSNDGAYRLRESGENRGCSLWPPFWPACSRLLPRVPTCAVATACAPLLLHVNVMLPSREVIAPSVRGVAWENCPRWLSRNGFLLFSHRCVSMEQGHAKRAPYGCTKAI